MDDYADPTVREAQALTNFLTDEVKYFDKSVKIGRK